VSRQARPFSRSCSDRHITLPEPDSGGVDELDRVRLRVEPVAPGRDVRLTAIVEGEISCPI